jgi:hypothetical protein
MLLAQCVSLSLLLMDRHEYPLPSQLRNQGIKLAFAVTFMTKMALTSTDFGSSQG